MRPRADIRLALATAAQELPTQLGRGATWRDMAKHARVGFAAAKATVHNMARAGELQPAGTVTSPSSRRPMTAFVPAQQVERACPVSSLDTLLRGWQRA